jgi:hypothetical protein
LSFGGTQQSSAAQSTSTGNAATTPTYNSFQTTLQSLLSNVMGTLLPSVASGGVSPNVQATETASADQINKSYSSLGDRMTKFLAARGFGQSGKSGQVQLQTELGRQGALAGNASAAAGQQLNLDTNYLSDALAFAFANPGSMATGTTTGSGTQSGSGSGWGFDVGGKIGGTTSGGLPWGIGG